MQYYYSPLSLSEVNNIQQTEPVFVFPNPSSGIFTVDFQNKTAEMKICVYDISGSCIHSQQFFSQNIYQIDLSGKAKGIYFVEVNTGDKRIVKKIILD